MLESLQSIQARALIKWGWNTGFLYTFRIHWKCSKNSAEVIQLWQFSGYKLNLSKSECFLIHFLALQMNAASLPFRLSGFQYFGGHITSTFSGLYANVILPLINKITSGLQRWDTLLSSLAGRVNCIKMNILGRFLYLFQSLPAFLPKTYLFIK